MLRKNNKRKFFTGLFLTPYFFTLVCLIVIAMIILPVYRNARQRFAVNGEIVDLQKQIASLQSSNDDLAKLETYLQSDQFAEKEARLNLGLKMPGEHVAVIENSGLNSQLDNGGSANDNTDKKNSNIRKWWNYFFGQ
ncbi:MAG: septum formation initiator family protein [Patescibacteria group bacterium]|nr:septum formation initiator family protein [Patescibacteria group bacterium]